MKKILLILMAGMLTACASISSTRVQTEGSPITREQVQGIKPGTTTKKAVIETFGNPVKIESKTDGSEVFTYIYTEKKTPSYFGEFVAIERLSRSTTVTLEITIKNELVSSYNLKKREEK